MGIVAFCPHGHRVKVKDELAGKKGICPTCGMRFRIPVKDARSPDAAALPAAVVVSADPRLVASLPAALPLDEPAAGARVVPPPDAVPDFEPVGSEPRAAAAAPTHAALDERPDLAWCFAVRGGAPSAPLDAAAFREWLDSGAATTDHVVWRADWPDWRSLADVFPDALPAAPPGWP